MTNQKSLGLETNTESATIPQNSHFGIAGGWVIKKKLSLIQSIIHSDKSRGGLIIKIFRFSKFLYSHVRVFVEVYTLVSYSQRTTWYVQPNRLWRVVYL